MALKLYLLQINNSGSRFQTLDKSSFFFSFILVYISCKIFSQLLACFQQFYNININYVRPRKQYLSFFIYALDLVLSAIFLVARIVHFLAMQFITDLEKVPLNEFYLS